MDRPTPNLWLGSGEGPSGPQPYIAPQSYQESPDDSMSDDEPEEPVTGVAQQARVVRTPPPTYPIRRTMVIERRSAINPEGTFREEIEVEYTSGRPPVPVMAERNRPMMVVTLEHSQNPARLNATPTPNVSSPLGTMSPSDTTPPPYTTSPADTTSPNPLSPNTSSENMVSDNTASPNPVSPNTTSPSKRKLEHALEEVTEGMGDLGVDEKRRRLDPTPTQRRPDWSRLTNPAFVGQSSSQTSVEIEQSPNIDTPMTDSVPGSTLIGKQYEIRESRVGELGMFATRNIPGGTIIAKEKSLVRLLGLDLYATEDDPSYRDMVNTLIYQFDYLASPADRAFTGTLDTLHSEIPFVLRVMQKYGFEAYHPEFFHCTALFRDICRVNHSCDDPNAWLDNWGNQNDCSTGRLRARRNIAQGEEILLDYTVVGAKIRDKMEVLKKYRFICARRTCKACYAGFDN